MSFTKKFDKMVYERFNNDIKSHIITLKHKDGLYQHYRCQKPGDCNLLFDIVTWPGNLCITGDMHSFLFARTENMINFMSRAARDPGYSAEKCIAHEYPIREFKKEIFYEKLDDFLKENKDNKNLNKIQKIKYEYEMYETEYDAEKAMFESGIFDEIPDCKYFSYHFLWCLLAIQWFCDNYGKLDDERKTSQQNSMFIANNSV